MGPWVQRTRWQQSRHLLHCALLAVKVKLSLADLDKSMHADLARSWCPCIHSRPLKLASLQLQSQLVCRLTLALAACVKQGSLRTSALRLYDGLISVCGWPAVSSLPESSPHNVSAYFTPCTTTQASSD